ncbi:hypothetical protein M2145_001046 [Lachnospiraceae bacterium PF1-21]|uniref:hypothetical protein n=1 Tax=Ohessyouella blattaphilus TaxID=2949333 RepID=UPI003E24E696
MSKKEVKGVILCPICKKGKVVAYNSASGESSIRCDICKNLVLLNYSTMTAERNEPEKGLFK